ncbi:hypothetical protein HB364_16905 [Pseudoflavitalea sp. X16]|uniref:hypothetical protein n=1 Tax=Paraflavitalea devenefica TaxID=2716334 RepID=UPI001421AB8C|nr:hypothetical protein [Paraflavitalea devenefica]NII26771.1 hypothetical protein [Paraflavitalea devenefica]
MRKKSSRKRHRLVHPETFRPTEGRQALTGVLILFCSVAVFIWSIFLLEDTFIPTRVLLLTVIAGGFAGIVILALIWKKEQYGWLIVLLFYGFLGGATPPFFAIAAINYYGKSSQTEQVTAEIIETGHRMKRGSGCGAPYAVVEFDNVSNKVYFDCAYKATIAQYKQVTMTLAKGGLGYYVIVDKQLRH